VPGGTTPWPQLRRARARLGLIVFLSLAAVVSLAVMGSSESSRAASVSECSPGLTALSAPQQIAPHLQLLQTSESLGSCPTPIRVVASSNDGEIYGVDDDGNLWRSSDNLASWHLVYKLPSGWDGIGQVLQLRSGYFLITALGPDLNWHVLRSTDTDASAFDVSQPSLTLPAGSRIRGTQSWTQLPDGSIVVGEYGNDPSPDHLWRSTDDGQSFTPVFSLPGQTLPTATCTCVRHVHSVLSDPFDPGRLWVTWGDTGNEPRIGYSDDAGAHFTFITQGGYYKGGSPRSRAVALDFAPDAVYWATDSPEMPAALYRWDRATGAITQVLSGLNGPFYDSVAWHGYLAQFSEVSTKSSDGYIGDEYIHAVTAQDYGSDWSTSKLPFMRDPAHTSVKAYIYGESAPDDTGTFWISFSNLNGSGDSGGLVNAELRFGDAGTSPAPGRQPFAQTLVLITHRARLRAGRTLTIRLACRRVSASTRACQGRLELRRSGRLIGSVRIAIGKGRSRSVKVRLGRRPWGRRRSFTVVVDVLAAGSLERLGQLTLSKRN
jgi:hypothetical protein